MRSAGSREADLQHEQRRISALITRKFRRYYLTGGTALAFYFRHRFSEDLDFFSQEYQRDEPDRIMAVVERETGYPFRLEAEEDDPRLVPMKVYTVRLKRGVPLKVDFLQDFARNLRPVRNGLHALEDIYHRKICAAIGGRRRESQTGRLVPSGRQSAKDAFDLCALSMRHRSLSDFFMRNFSEDEAERLIVWWKGFDRMRLKLELTDLISKSDPAKVIVHLDGEILKRLPQKLL